jgi:dipeptidyl aminopeptidase/acylaminoacyl peptidase
VFSLFEEAGPVWSPDGTQIAVDASDIPRRDPKKAYRITRLNWRLDGRGLIDDVRGDVWVVPAAGGEPRRLTADDGVISFLEWSPDGASILYGTFGAGDDTDYAIRAVDVSSGDCRTITCGPLLGDVSVAAWIADGKVVYSSPWKINKRIELVVCDPRDRTHETRMPDPEGQLFADMVAGFDSSHRSPDIGRCCWRVGVRLRPAGRGASDHSGRPCRRGEGRADD